MRRVLLLLSSASVGTVAVGTVAVVVAVDSILVGACSRGARAPCYETTSCDTRRLRAGTTKGTGGDAIILEEAAYVDQGFFYETVAPLLLIGVTSLICISTLTSDIK